MTTDVRTPLLLQEGSGLVRPQDGNAITDWPSIRQWVLTRDGHTCQICMASPASDVDHVWPRRLGGRDHIANLRAACGPCNKAKGSRVNYEMATRSELHAAVDALANRVEAALDELLPIVGWVALAQPGDLPWATLRLANVRESMSRAMRASVQAVERQRVYDAAPSAEVIDFPTRPSA